MSAAIEAVDPSQVQPRKYNEGATSANYLEGDVLSRQSFAVAPPSIQQVWEYNS